MITHEELEAQLELSLATQRASIEACQAAGGLLCGIISVDGELTPLYSPDGSFTSERGFGDSAYISTKRRMVTTPASLVDVDAYTFSPAGESAVESDAGTVTKSILGGNAALVADARGKSSFALFQAEDVRFPMVGRTGFVVKPDGESMRVVQAGYDGRRYLLDLKGCGSPAGTFAFRGGAVLSKPVWGGLPLPDAAKEFEWNLREHLRGRTPIVPLAFGGLVLNEAALRESELGIVARLLPSTVRLSHIDSPAFPPTETAEERMLILAKLIDIFLDKFLYTDDGPIGLSQASHLENYLLNEGLDITETDFEDFKEFGSSEIPYVHEQSANFVDTRRIIEHYFTNFGRLHNFNPEADLPNVRAYIEQSLEAQGVTIDLSSTDSMQDVGRALWDQWLIKLDYLKRGDDDPNPTELFRFLAANAVRASSLRLELLEMDEAADKAGAALQDAANRQTFTAEQQPSVDTWLKATHYQEMLSMTDEISNRDRFTHALQMFYDVLEMRLGAHDAFDNRGVEPQESIYDDFCALQFEYILRVFGAATFYAKYIESEIRTRRLLLTMDDPVIQADHEKLEFELASYERAYARVKAVVDSTDYKEAIDFAGTIGLLADEVLVSEEAD